MQSKPDNVGWPDAVGHMVVGVSVVDESYVGQGVAGEPMPGVGWPGVVGHMVVGVSVEKSCVGKAVDGKLDVLMPGLVKDEVGDDGGRAVGVTCKVEVE